MVFILEMSLYIAKCEVQLFKKIICQSNGPYSLLQQIKLPELQMQSCFNMGITKMESTDDHVLCMLGFIYEDRGMKRSVQQNPIGQHITVNLKNPSIQR